MIKKMITIYFLLLLSLFVTTGRQIAAEEGCVLQLHFDEGEGQVVKDSSGKNNNGEIFNAKWVKEGKSGSALKFDVYDVNSNYVNCGSGKSLDITDAITLEAWIKPARAGGADQSIISKEWLVPYSLNCVGGGTGAAMILRFSDGSETRLDTGKCLTIGEWNHVVATYDGKEQKIYVNGKLEEGPEHIGKPIKSISYHPVFIGCIHPGNNHFDGTIDEVKIYNRALSEKEITSSYKSAGGKVKKDVLEELVVSEQITEEVSQKTYSQQEPILETPAGDGKDCLIAVLSGNGDIKEIKIANEIYARDLGIHIENIGSQPFGKQSSSENTRAMKREEDGKNLLFKGRITSSEPRYKGRDFLADVKSFLYKENVESMPGQIKLNYELTADIGMEGILVKFTGSLPQEAIDKITYVVHTHTFTKKGTISEITNHPKEMIEPAAFSWIGWLFENGRGIKIKPETGIYRVRLDNEGFVFYTPKFFFRAKENIAFNVVVEPLTIEEVDELIARKNIPPLFEDKLDINSISENSRKVGKYEKFEITLDVSATYSDAFDPDQIDIEGYFTAPSGNITNVCGFLYQDYESDSADIWYLKAKGEPCWKIRFAPVETGKYTYYVTVKDRSGKVSSKKRTFQCVPSKNPGFVRVSQKDPLYFEFDRGDFYYPIGQGVPWTGPHWWQLDYDHYFTKMAKHGIDATREWGMQVYPAKVTDRLSLTQRLGYQNLGDNWQIDQMVESAEKNGMYIMFCMLNHVFFLDKKHSLVWYEQSPYEITKGGVCYEPREFFTKKEARDLFKRELRYMVARWGYTPAVWVWELWNEHDGAGVMHDCGEENILSWYKEITPYLRSIDPWKHLISTSFCNPGTPVPKKIHELPNMDIVQYHMYPNANAAFPTVKGMLGLHGLFKFFNKPAIVGEFGIPSPPHAERFDFFGTSYHYGIWSSIMLPSLSGIAMAQGGPEQIEQSDLYFIYEGIARFMEGEDRRGKEFKPAPLTINKPSLGVCGIQNNREAQFWIYSRDPRVAGELPQEGVPSFPVFKDVTVTLSGLRKGKYKVEFWDTWKGKVIRTENLKTRNDGSLTIEISELEEDIAAKVRFVR